MEINGSPASVKFDGTDALSNGECVIATPEDITLHMNDDANTVVEEVGFVLKLVVSCKRKRKNLSSLLF